jgi:hypothetical protein
MPAALAFVKLEMNRAKLVQPEQIFRTFIKSPMDENGTDDLGFIWEFERYLNSKTDEIASAENKVEKNGKRHY